MTQSELIAVFPQEMGIPDRVLLITPAIMPQLLNVSVQECRVFLLISRGRLTAKVGSTIMEI